MRTARGCLLALFLAAAGACSSAYVRLPVRGQGQRHNLSCESRSACDLLAWYGRNVDEDAFRLGLPVSDNPDLGFVGDVDGPGGGLPPAGYGVHAGPVAARLRDYGLAARAVRDVDLTWLKRELSQGRPVVVWAPVGLDAPPPVRLRDGRGRTFLAVRGEHTFLAIGYSGGDLFLLDPALGEVKRVSERRFDAAWSLLGRSAVTVGATSSEIDTL